MSASSAPLHWPAGDTSRIPFAVYTDEQLHQRELERFFYQGHWCYVGLEAEVPNPGDFKRTVVGERSVILSRAADGSLHCVENVCAHRGMQFCRARHGNRKEFVCPYHQWSYTLTGDLQGVPLRRGVRQEGQVKGGMPADFNPKEHGLTKLKVATRGNAGKQSDVSQVTSFKSSMALEDPRFLDIVHEDWWGEPTAVMTTIFPSVIFQQQVNSVSTRHIQPDGHGNFDFVWTHFGFADDTPEMTARRLRQANLFGPAGFVSADDGEAIELSQCGFKQKPGHRALAELGGRGVEETDHMVTETLIRGMYEYWRKVMEA